MALKNRTILTLLSIAALAAGCHSSPGTPLCGAAARGDLQEVRSQIARGADVNQRGGAAMTALMWAARGGNPHVVEALLRAGADPNARDGRSTGWTALVHALHKGKNDAVRALLEGGADPNVRCAGGATALMYAAAYGNTIAVRALLDAGADPYAEASGVTALWNAAGGGAVFDFTDGPALGTCFPETAEALLEKAPDLKLPGGLPDRVVSALSRSEECSTLLAKLSVK